MSSLSKKALKISKQVENTSYAQESHETSAETESYSVEYFESRFFNKYGSNPRPLLCYCWKLRKNENPWQKGKKHADGHLYFLL